MRLRGRGCLLGRSVTGRGLLLLLLRGRSVVAPLGGGLLLGRGGGSLPGELTELGAAEGTEVTVRQRSLMTVGALREGDLIHDGQ